VKHSTFVAAALLIFSTSLVCLSRQSQTDVRSRIEGIVIKAGDGEPLAGVVVLLRREGAAGSEKQYGTTTTSNGVFSLTDIPKGRYILAASKSGFTNQEYGQKRPNSSGAVLDLTTSTILRNVTFRLGAGGAITGRVSDQNGKPVEGTLIRAFSRRYQRDGTTTLSDVDTAVTNDLGEYRMYWVPPGSYYLLAIVLSANRASMNPANEPTVVNESLEPPDVFAPVFYANSEDESQATAIRVESGSELRGVDFSVVRTKAVRIKGRAANSATGQPVFDAVLELRSQYNAGQLRNLSLSAHTDEKGNFEFSNAAPGSYTLLTRWTEPGFRSMSTQQDLRVESEDILDLQINLQPNPGISGRVIMEHGEKAPQNRTLLLFTESSGTSFGTGLLSDGTFALTNLSAGVLHVELTGFPDDFFIRSARSGSKDVLREGINLANGAVDTLEVIVATKGGTVEGVVNDSRKSPALGAVVVLMPNTDRRDRSYLVKTVRTDQYGRFAIRGIAPGDYKVFSWDDLEPNIFFDPSFMDQYESQGKTILMEEDGYVTLDLSAISVR
jgi:uncharacterized surface anchored protein